MTRILVVEDELAVADVIELSLRRGGFDVEVVHGRRAAELRLEPGRCAAIILDLGLPDGLFIARRDHHDGSIPSSVWSKVRTTTWSSPSPRVSWWPALAACCAEPAAASAKTRRSWPARCRTIACGFAPPSTGTRCP